MITPNHNSSSFLIENVQQAGLLYCIFISHPMICTRAVICQSTSRHFLTRNGGKGLQKIVFGGYRHYEL